MDQQASGHTGLLDLPTETLIYIFEFLSFDEVSKFRIICKRIDEICQKILNSGFRRAIQFHAATYKRIKAKLPRRESERRNHALSRHADILTTVETRISMLSMTYSKYMDMNMCCFIPGRVLDEIFRILHLTTRAWIPWRPLEVLQEFRDLSSMAMEHFDEKIACEFKKILELNSLARLQSIGASSVGVDSSSTNNCMRRIFINEYRRSKSNYVKPSENDVIKLNEYPTLQKKYHGTSNVTMRNFQHQIVTLQRKRIQQKKHLAFFVRKVNCMSRQMKALKRRLDELDSKNQDLIGTIRQYSLEDSQAEVARTSGTTETKSITNETIQKNDITSETRNINDQHLISSAVIQSNIASDDPSREFKLVRKALKRHFNKAFTFNENESELDNQSLNKKNRDLKQN